MLADQIEQRLVGASHGPVVVRRPAEYIAIAELAADGKVAGWDSATGSPYRLARAWLAEH